MDICIINVNLFQTQNLFITELNIFIAMLVLENHFSSVLMKIIFPVVFV